MANGDINEYSSGSSIRAEQTPPKKSTITKQMIDFRGFPLSTEEGNVLVTDKETYKKDEYTAKNAPSVVLDTDSYRTEGISSQNKFSKRSPAAFPIEERFQETSEVSRSLLGINRETTQQGIFGNVSTYGLDEKDWRIDGTPERDPDFWYNRPSATGRYFNSRFEEDTTNSALVISTSPSPYTTPGKPDLQEQLISPGGGEGYRGWGQYLNSIIAQYLIEYMVENFDDEGLTNFNLNYLLTKYPPIIQPDGSKRFNRLLWDKIWLDIRQRRFGADTDYPIIPTGRAFNFLNEDDTPLTVPLRDPLLWGQPGSNQANVIIIESNAVLNTNEYCAWDSFFFSTTRVYYPYQSADDKGHYRIQTNPTPELWEKYFGLRWDYLREDLKNWQFTIHRSPSTVTQMEKDLKLPYFILSNPLEPNPTNLFSNSWPNEFFGTAINLPTVENRIGGAVGPGTEMSITSLRAFRYQPGRISGFTYGSKVSEIGAGAGTTIEWGIENDTDGYFFRLKDGADFQIIRRSIIPLEDTPFLADSGYSETTRTVVKNGRLQYETTVEQKNMNGDPLNGGGESGYILDPDTVTMYKIEFGWYGAIGARFYAYIPEGNGDCRWVSLHTFVIENQLGRPCLGDPFFYFKYRLRVSDPSTIRLDQFLHKFGASYYIDGYDQGTLYSSFAKSKVRKLSDPKFTQTKKFLYARDWTTLMGIKPRQYLYNRFGEEIYNKKEIFPKSFSIYSQSACEIKIVRQKGCPEYAYTHQEGYRWNYLPESRRIKGRFNIRNYTRDSSNLGIVLEDGNTHTATMTYNGSIGSGGWRNPISLSSYSSYLDNTSNPGDLRIVGDDLFQLAITSYQGDLFSNQNEFKLSRVENLARGYLSSADPAADKENVYLPFTYAPIDEYLNGYEVEFDYYRRDQILLSTVNITSNEFFIFWTGGSSGGLSPNHRSSIRIGFAWPDGNNPNGIIGVNKGKDWGIELPANPGEYIEYDGEKFYEGLPIDLTTSAYENNSIYIESGTSLGIDPYNVERNERSHIEDRWDLEDIDFRPPGAEGGECRGLGCRNGIEVKEAQIIKVVEEEEGVEVETFYLQALSAWPNPGGSYSVTLSAAGEKETVSVSNPTVILIGDTRFYRVKLLSSLPAGFSENQEIDVSYSIIYIAEIDKKSQVKNILVSRIGGGDIPFCRVFIQARQGQSLGGVWIGQKTSNGIVLDPFTPHSCTLNIKDSGEERSGEGLGQPTDGAIKNIRTTIAYDPLGEGTAPTILDQDGYVDETFKSIHSSPRKCGSFLSEGGTASAGILSVSDYPIRWLTSDFTGLPLGTFYVPENESVEISLEDIFNINAESIVNSDDANLATFFIARSLNNHDPADSTKEIYMSLNYDEQ